MDDLKVRLLMEETGCEQGEAGLALELAGNDLEKAIRTIESLLRHIYAFKGKCFFQEKNLYGFFLLVINTKAGEILRFHSVVSYNPALFENSLAMDWYAFEKVIFSYRLDEGSIPDFTQENEQRLSAHLLTRKDLLTGGNIQDITGMLTEFFADAAAAVAVNIETEELNLAQFRQLPDAGATSSAKSAESGQEPGIVLLQVEFLEDKNGKEACRLGEGEVVLSKITDTRDIAHYLAHLIGGRREDGMIPLPSSVRRVASADEGCEVQVYLAPGVVGITKVSNDLRVKVMEMKSNPWWKKILPW
jgi:hypothetical protein